MPNNIFFHPFFGWFVVADASVVVQKYSLPVFVNLNFEFPENFRQKYHFQYFSSSISSGFEPTHHSLYAREWRYDKILCMHCYLFHEIRGILCHRHVFHIEIGNHFLVFIQPKISKMWQFHCCKIVCYLFLRIYRL